MYIESFAASSVGVVAICRLPNRPSQGYASPASSPCTAPKLHLLHALVVFFAHFVYSSTELDD